MTKNWLSKIRWEVDKIGNKPYQQKYSTSVRNQKWNKNDYFCTPLYLFPAETTIITEAVFSTLSANLLLPK